MWPDDSLMGKIPKVDTCAILEGLQIKMWPNDSFFVITPRKVDTSEILSHYTQLPKMSILQTRRPAANAKLLRQNQFSRSTC